MVDAGALMVLEIGSSLASGSTIMATILKPRKEYPMVAYAPPVICRDSNHSGLQNLTRYSFLVEGTVGTGIPANCCAQSLLSLSVAHALVSKLWASCAFPISRQLWNLKIMRGRSHGRCLPLHDQLVIHLA